MLWLSKKILSGVIYHWSGIEYWREKILRLAALAQDDNKER